jgi:hypothetical protein
MLYVSKNTFLKNFLIFLDSIIKLILNYNLIIEFIFYLYFFVKYNLFYKKILNDKGNINFFINLKKLNINCS